MDLCSIRDLAAAGIAFCIILYVTLTTSGVFAENVHFSI